MTSQQVTQSKMKTKKARHKTTKSANNSSSTTTTIATSSGKALTNDNRQTSPPPSLPTSISTTKYQEASQALSSPQSVRNIRPRLQPRSSPQLLTGRIRTRLKRLEPAATKQPSGYSSNSPTLSEQQATYMETEFSSSTSTPTRGLSRSRSPTKSYETSSPHESQTAAERQARTKNSNFTKNNASEQPSKRRQRRKQAATSPHKTTERRVEHEQSSQARSRQAERGRAG